MTTTTTAANSTIKDLGVFEEGEKMTLEKIDYARLRYSGSENYIDICTALGVIVMSADISLQAHRR